MKKNSKKNTKKPLAKNRKKNPFAFNDGNVRRWLYINLPKHFPDGILEGNVSEFIYDFTDSFSYPGEKYFIDTRTQKKLDQMYYKPFEKIYGNESLSKREKDKLWRDYMIGEA